MTRAQRNRLKSGLHWRTSKAPWPSLMDWLMAAVIGLAFLLVVSLLGTLSANGEAKAAEAARIKYEVALVTILNGDPLIIDRDSGTVVLAMVETAGGE